ncbi:MAG: hypothetical protein ACE5KH_00895 [Candidatus Geothermarchaeales archaeon]
MGTRSQRRRLPDRFTSRGTFLATLFMFTASPILLLYFPRLTSQIGGWQLTLASLATLLIIGTPIFLTETALGSMLRKGLPGSMRALNPRLEFIGWLALTNVFLLSVSLGVTVAWSTAHATLSLINDLQAPILPSLLTPYFTDLARSPLPLIAVLIVWGLTYTVARQGPRGLERTAAFLLPTALLLVAGLAIYGATTPTVTGSPLEPILSSENPLQPADLRFPIQASVLQLGLGLGVLTMLASYTRKKAETNVAALTVPPLGFALALVATLIVLPLALDLTAPQGLLNLVYLIPQVAASIGGPILIALFSSLLAILGFTTILPMTMALVSELTNKFQTTRRKAAAATSILAAAASLPYVWWFHTVFTPIEDGVILGFRLINGTEFYILFLGPALVLVLLLAATLASLRSGEVVAHSNYVSTIRLPQPYKYLILVAAPAGAVLLLGFLINEILALFTSGSLSGVEILSILYWAVPTVLATAVLTASPGWKEKP